MPSTPRVLGIACYFPISVTNHRLVLKRTKLQYLDIEIILEKHANNHCCDESFRFLSFTEYGFVHNLSPIKKSRNNSEWYQFELQTSPIKTTRVVGFNIPSHSKLKDFETSKTPVLLNNIKPKDNEIIFNQQSSLNAAANSDVPFDYVQQDKPENSCSNALSQSVDVSVSDIKTLKANQRINLNAIITIGPEDPKQVTLTKTQESAYVKEDCVIEDYSGSIMAHIWAPLMHQLKNGQAYHFTNLTIRNYKGSTFISSSPLTTAKPSPLTMETLVGPQMLQTPTNEVKCDNFKLISKLSVFASCALCHKRLNDVASANSLKCHNCGTRQRAKDITREASVKVCIEDKEGTKWLTAFTKNILKLLAPFKVTLQSNSDDIEEALMNIEDVVLTYNVQTETIKDIVSFKEPSLE